MWNHCSAWEMYELNHCSGCLALWVSLCGGWKFSLCKCYKLGWIVLMVGRICLGWEVFNVFFRAIVGSEIVHCFIGREYCKHRLALGILFVWVGLLFHSLFLLWEIWLLMLKISYSKMFNFVLEYIDDFRWLDWVAFGNIWQEVIS